MTKFLSTGFRPNIQGLRAIAVLLVILHHSGILWVAGGFVGVDVFFVLSGFLITGLLLHEYDATGRLSLGAFYLRRLRRLLPVLIVVLGVTAAVVCLLLPEADSRSILASLPYAASWTSNLFFALGEQDYFNELADKDVFLHTWSLGVEEQFYLLWPLLILRLSSIAKLSTLRRHLFLLVIMSFLISVIWTHWKPISAFYMMPARIWQFGLGGLICLYVIDLRSDDHPVSGHKPKILLTLGLAFILGSAFFLDDKMLYPGYWALFPSLGAVFVILAGSLERGSEGSSTGLAHPVLVWLGDRSYFLYLWHWPIIVLMGLSGFAAGSGHIGTLLVLLLTILLAMFSYRWIELPFWKQSLKSLPPKTFLMGSSATVLLMLAVAFHVQRIPSDNIDQSIDLIVSLRTDVPAIYNMNCDAWYQHSKVEPCVFGPVDAPHTAVLPGYSIGVQWFSAFAQIYISQQWRLVVLTKSACAMVDEDYFYSRIGKVYNVCRQWRDEVLKQIKSYNPSVIIVGSSATYDFSPEQWVEGSKRVLEKLSVSAEHVVLVSGTPVLGFDGPTCIATQLRVNGELNEGSCISEKSTEKFDKVADFLSTSAKEFPNVQVFNTVDLVCPKGQCRALSPIGVPIFRDSQHLTET